MKILKNFPHFNYYFILLIAIKIVGSRNVDVLTTKELESERPSPATNGISLQPTPFSFPILPNSLQMPTKGSSWKIPKGKKKPIAPHPLHSPPKFKNLEISKNHYSDASGKSRKYENQNSKSHTKPGIPASKNSELAPWPPTTYSRPRTLVMTTIGIINGFIAAGAALSMGGVMLTGLLFMVKMAITAMLVGMGWIYVM